MPEIHDPVHYLRKERSRLLRGSDWEMMRANETGIGLKALKTYRQALRDLPENVSPEWSETQEANEIARIRVKGKLQYLNVDLHTKP